MSCRPFKYHLATFAILLLCALPCAAQQAIPAKIDRYIRDEMRKQKIPGLSLAIVRNGRVAILKSYGFANVEHRVPVKPETVFQSGSIAKQFAAVAIMILVEEGKISLDDKITRFFPDAPATWKDITVRHLLTHTSGMGDYPPEIDLRREYTEDEYLDYFKKAPLAFEPGTKWDYSNVGYVTLGILIRKVTGKFYGDFLQERIFAPLGMTTARVISEADIVPNRAAGYRLVQGALQNQGWVSPSTNTTADGSLYFTILDLAKWDAALYTDRPLKQASLTQVWSPARMNDGKRKGYGFGWHTDLIHNRRVVFHGGAWQGFKSFIMRFVDDKLTIIFLANSWDTRELKLARGLAAIFFPEFALPTAQSTSAQSIALSIPAGSIAGQSTATQSTSANSNAAKSISSQSINVEPIEDREPKVTSLVRRALLQLSQGRADPDLFTPEFRAEIFGGQTSPAAKSPPISELLPSRAQQLRDKLNSLSVPVAVIHMTELIERRNENNLRVYRYLLIDIGRTLSCTVKLTNEDKMLSLELSEL